jgi:hypothetical protein
LLLESVQIRVDWQPSIHRAKGVHDKFVIFAWVRLS